MATTLLPSFACENTVPSRSLLKLRWNVKTNLLCVITISHSYAPAFLQHIQDFYKKRAGDKISSLFFFSFFRLAYGIFDTQ